MKHYTCERCGLQPATYRMLIGGCRLCWSCSEVFVRAKYVGRLNQS